jgi:hypothetical protein
VTLVLGTLQGVWEIETTKGRWPWQRLRQRFLLSGCAIRSFALLPSGSPLALTENGEIWQRSLARQQWRRSRTISKDHAKSSSCETSAISANKLMTTALAASVDGTLWRGTTPAALWYSSLPRTHDPTWHEVTGLRNIPGASEWWGLDIAAQPSLTAIVPDPRAPLSMAIAVAVGGIFHTMDGGVSWRPQHQGIPPLMPLDGARADLHRDVIALTRHPAYSQILYATTETAIYRTEALDDIWEWHDITPEESITIPGSISAVVAAPQKPLHAFVIAPLDEAQSTIWETIDGGQHWQPLAGAPILPMAEPGQQPQLVVDPFTSGSLAVVAPDGRAYYTCGHEWKMVISSTGSITCAIWLPARQST